MSVFTADSSPFLTTIQREGGGQEARTLYVGVRTLTSEGYYSDLSEVHTLAMESESSLLSCCLYSLLVSFLNNIILKSLKSIDTLRLYNILSKKLSVRVTSRKPIDFSRGPCDVIEPFRNFASNWVKISSIFVLHCMCYGLFSSINLHFQLKLLWILIKILVID